jgi:uroporphyrinogen-III synthase
LKVKKILISQPQPANLEKSPYGLLPQKYGVVLDFEKFIKIEGVTAKEFRKDRINILDHSAIIFTSRQAVDHFFRIAKDMRVEVPDTMKYFCTTESTALYLQKYIQYRKRKIFFGTQKFADLMDTIKKHKNENFLLPCADIHKKSIPDLLESNEIKFKKAIIYRTLPSDLSSIDILSYDMVVFFSPSGVESLFQNYPEFKQESMIIAAFGPTTCKAVEDRGLTLNIKAPSKSAPSMSMAIEQYLEKSNKKRK